MLYKRQLAGDSALMMIESTLQKGADYFREMSVLVLVFIPVDLWKHAKIEPRDVLEVFYGSALLFMIGMAFEWTSYAVARSRETWAREQAQ